MTQTVSNEPRAVDMGFLLALANRSFARSVDCDMRGSPITDCEVLLHGAYGQAVTRLVNLAVQKQEGKPVNMARLRRLAAEAFAQGVDYDFGGNQMTDYSLVLQEKYGFGAQTLSLVNLAIQHYAALGRPTAAQ